jgi:hypothetical protein
VKAPGVARAVPPPPPSWLDLQPLAGEPVSVAGPPASGPAVEAVEAPPPPRRGRPRKAAATVEPEAADDGRPTIQVTTELRVMADAAIKALADGAEAYQREGRLVRVVRVAQEEGDETRLVGSPEIRPFTAPVLRIHLAERARWVRFDGRRAAPEAAKPEAAKPGEKAAPKGAWVPTTPPADLAAGLVDLGEYRDVRRLVGVAETPFLRPDGTVLQVPGYDARTGYLLVPGAEFPEVKAHPTQADAAAGLAELAEVFRDFPHASAAAASVPVAALLTLLARPAIEGPTPANVIDGNVPGCGKSRITDAVAIMGTGRPMARAQYPDNEEERKKVLGATALHGAPMLAFDNVESGFGGAGLCACLTSTSVQMRILGASENPTLPWRTVIFATGNNVEIVGDANRRCLIDRLESTLERPEERTDFAHTNLLGWVTQNRPRLVSAALTVLRAYAAAGWPSPPVWGSFESWSKVVAGAIIYAGGPNVLDVRGGTGDAVDPTKAALAALLGGLAKLSPGRGMTARDIIARLWSVDRLKGLECAPDDFDGMREAIEYFAPPPPRCAPDAGKLGHAFKKHKGRFIEGAALAGKMDRNSVVRWEVSRG